MRKRAEPSNASGLQIKFYNSYDLDDEKCVYRASFFLHMKTGKNGFESRKV